MIIDAAEDRERFDELLEQCGIPRAKGTTVFTTEEAVKAADELGYPVLLRPSYVLGGQNMIIAYSESDVRSTWASSPPMRSRTPSWWTSTSWVPKWKSMPSVTATTI